MKFCSFFTFPAGNIPHDIYIREGMNHIRAATWRFWIIIVRKRLEAHNINREIVFLTKSTNHVHNAKPPWWLPCAIS